MQCPQCSAPLPGDFAFCPYCAAPLHAQAEPLHEERKVVSVLFCDLVGFTAASEHADPEDVRARLRRYHHQLRQVIESHGGTVEKFIGDAVMAVFGAPVAHEDDAERAVRAGLRILEAIDDLNRNAPELHLQVRIGVNTGEAVVALGAPAAMGEGFVAGDVVNTASRIQSAAPPGQLAIADSTHRQVERSIHCERLPPVSVPGKSQPLGLWRAVRPRARFGADVVRTHATPLVGRELERPLLIALFERAAKQRACQLVTLIGEPGVGKTRLCTELLEYAEQRPGLVRWRQGRCLPYGEGVAFWALGEIVKAECGILDSDSSEEAGRKLDETIAEGEADRAWLRSRLAPLVGAGGEPTTQEESFAAWRRFIESLASDPTVLVFEDLHWADDALLSFVEYLADWTEGLPLLLLCTARPELQERRPNWAAGLRNAQTISLAPLSDDETTTLLGLLLRRAVLPARVQQVLLERAGGNPLYAEEFVRLLGDRQLLAGPLDEVPFPDSLQALIAARLDTLSRERKSLLQDAAVVGKVFWVGALAAMGERDERDVEQALHDLARKELVRPARSSSVQGEVEYSFWHLLLRDVCYAQIPRQARAARHRAAAAWMERSAGERVDDLADVLAHHYLEALDLVRSSGDTAGAAELQDAARKYLLMAGERALPLDVSSAEASFAKALALTPQGHPQRALALERWALAVQEKGRLVDAREALNEALAIHRAQHDTVAVGRVLTTLAALLRIAGDTTSRALIADAITVLQSAPPGPELVAAQGEEAGACISEARFAECKATAERAVDLAQRLGLPPPVRALGLLGASRSQLGDRSGLDSLVAALRLALDQGKSRDAALMYNNLALATWQHLGPARAMEIAEEGIAFCERRGLVLQMRWIEVLRLTFLVATGRPAEALPELDALALALAEGDDTIRLEARALEVLVRSKLGEPPKHDVDQLVAEARHVAEPQMMSVAYGSAIPALVAKGRQEQARNLLRELRDTAGIKGDQYYAVYLPELVRTALLLGDRGLAATLLDGIVPLSPMRQLAISSATAALIEPRDALEAASRYAAAAAGWHSFGVLAERAYALLGAGRIRITAGLGDAEPALREARDIFESLGYRRDAAEASELLHGVTTGSG